MKTLADAFDDYVHWLVLWVLLSALNLALEAATYLFEGDTGTLLRDLALIPSWLGLPVILVGLFVFLRARRRAGRTIGRADLVDSYVVEALKRAALVAFLVTLPTIVLLDVATNHTSLPADFFIKLPGVALTASFGITFLIVSMSGPRDDLDELSGT